MQIDGKWGYVDARGRWVVKPKFDSTFAYRGGEAIAQVWVPPTAKGFIDIIPWHHFGKVTTLRLDRRGRTLEKWPGGSDRSPKRKQEPAESPGDIYAEPIPGVEVLSADWPGLVDGYASVTAKGRGRGVINAQGRLVVDFRDYGFSFSKGGYFLGHRKSGWGVLDATRDLEVVPFTYPDGDVKLMGDRRGAVTLAIRDQTRQWCVLDSKGNTLACGFSGVADAEQDAVAVQGINGCWGAIDAQGTTLFAPRYSDPLRFREQGLARVKQGASVFYIDRQGREYRSQPLEDPVESCRTP